MSKVLAAVLMIFMSVSVYAGDIDWSVCSKEVKEYQCKGDDKQIWTCLEKNDEKLSKSCQVSHAKGDTMFKK